MLALTTRKLSCVFNLNRVYYRMLIGNSISHVDLYHTCAPPTAGSAQERCVLVRFDFDPQQLNEDVASMVPAFESCVFACYCSSTYGMRRIFVVKMQEKTQN